MIRTTLNGADLEAFLADNCSATRAKYAAELEHANGEWQKPLDLWYAETLVDYFGLLERNVETLYDESGKHVRGSRITFRKRLESTHFPGYALPFTFSTDLRVPKPSIPVRTAQSSSTFISGGVGQPLIAATHDSTGCRMVT